MTRKTDAAGSRLARMLAMAGQRTPLRTAVAHPRDAVSFAGAFEAGRLGGIEPMLEPL